MQWVYFIALADEYNRNSSNGVKISVILSHIRPDIGKTKGLSFAFDNFVIRMKSAFFIE